MNPTQYPRVTEIISATDSEENKKRLLRWQKKMEKLHGIEGAKRVKQDILDNGTNFHQSVEDFLYQKVLDNPHPSLPIVIPFLRSLKSSEKIIEKRLYCHKYRYQGKPDLICNYYGEYTVFDWTTSQALKKKEWVEHKFLQAGAYAIASEEELGLKIRQLSVVVVVDSKQKYQLFTESPTKWKEAFLERLKQYYSEVKQNV